MTANERKCLDKLIQMNNNSEFDKNFVEQIFKLLKIGLKFNEKFHKYLSPNGYELTSVTNWIHWDSAPFNPYRMSQIVSESMNSKYYQMNPEVIRKNWRLNAIRATNKHKQYEEWLEGQFDNLPDKDVVIGYGFTPENCLSEKRIYSEKYGLAGTIDLITFKFDIQINKTRLDLEISDIKTFAELSEDRTISYSRQIYTYCLLIHSRLKEFNKILKENGIFINIKPGRVLHIQPSQDLTNDIDVNDMDNYNKPNILELDDSQLDVVKNELTARKKSWKP